MKLPEINDRDWFSYAGMERIKSSIRAKLQRDGDYDEPTDDLRLYFDVVRGFEQALREKKTYKQRSGEWYAKQIAKNPPVDSRLNDEEKEYILTRLMGANDPIGQSILKKLETKGETNDTTGKRSIRKLRQRTQKRR